ncbi:hypothetical protein AB1Y20_019819 [Prymnesium parvum]|uniref:YrhK domain-containing protein n=1 Tax=Prymnesium parvum TaxID=97485 RepID=A0AB34JS20_PRYPA
MGKVTFRRVVRVLHRNYVLSSLPVVGGTLFLAGSFLFWPGSSEQTELNGALCFLVGSVCYWVAPLMDFWELSFNQANLLEPPRVPTGGVIYVDQAAALYEHLYKAHLLRIQRANCLIYMLGGGFFVGGSTLFFPAMSKLIMHGGWLYIAGCLLTLLGAVLAAVTAHEMMKTAQPLVFSSSTPCIALPFWSDEEATIASCAFYVGGNLTFISGSILFFPRILEAGGSLIRLLACLLFIFGSILFILGALIDLIILVRAYVVQTKKLPRWRVAKRKDGRGKNAGGIELRPICDAPTQPANAGVTRRKQLHRTLSAPIPASRHKLAASCSWEVQQPVLHRQTSKRNSPGRRGHFRVEPAPRPNATGSRSRAYHAMLEYSPASLLPSSLGRKHESASRAPPAEEPGIGEGDHV